MVAVVRVSSSVKVWTADRFERRAEGKAEGFDFVVIIVEEVSEVRVREWKIMVLIGLRTSVIRATYLTIKSHFLVTRSSIQQVAAVGTENE